MPVRKIRPITPGTRHRIAPIFSELTGDRPEKSLLLPFKRKSGRNAQGTITVRHRGGGHKRRLRDIDFLRTKSVPATVRSIEYDPHRTAYVARLYYADGAKSYIVAPEGVQAGQQVSAGEKASYQVGNRMQLSRLSLGAVVHNIELQPGKGGVLVRSAGTYAQLLARDGKYATIKLPSGEMRQVLSTCSATIGTVSNSDHMNQTIGKAGRRRWMGRRPRVRGVAMNPVDHPMGGGEGKASGGHPRSYTGVYAKGLRTRKKNKYSSRLIITRRKK